MSRYRFLRAAASMEANLASRSLQSITSNSIPFFVDLIIIMVIIFVLLITAYVIVVTTRDDTRAKRKKRHTDFKKLTKGRHEALDDMKMSSDFYKANGYSWDFIIAVETGKIYDAETNSLKDAALKYRHGWRIDKHHANALEDALDVEIKSDHMMDAADLRSICDGLVAKLESINFDVMCVYSLRRDKVFIKIRAKLEMIKDEASKIGYRLQLDPLQCKRRLAEGNEPKWKGVTLNEQPMITRLSPYSYIYASYSKRDELQRLYKNQLTDLDADKQLEVRTKERLESLEEELRSSLSASMNLSMSDSATASEINENKRIIESLKARKTELEAVLTKEQLLFSSKDRIFLILSIIHRQANFHMAHLKKHNYIAGFFPVHNYAVLDKLERDWMFSSLFYIPAEQIKDYFGEKIALYYEWLRLYTNFLAVAALMGLFAWGFVASNNNNPNSAIIPYYSAIMALWATCLMEVWKRRMAILAMEWGTTDYEQEERDRPEFHGIIIESPIDGSSFNYFSESQMYLRYGSSSFFTFLQYAAALGVNALILYLRLLMLHESSIAINGVLLGSYIASTVNTIQILVCNYLFSIAAKELTDFENHRTDSSFESSLIWKTFIFQFINSYATLFYVAFAKQNLEFLNDSCANDDCLAELKTTLGIIFVTKLIVNIGYDFGYPLLNQYVREKEKWGGNVSAQEMYKISDIEHTFMQEELIEKFENFDDYAEDAMQFGFLTMFVSAFPLAAMVCYVKNLISIKVGAWKLCHVYRRPVPQIASSSGAWVDVFEIIGVFAVVTNTGLIAFTSTLTQHYSTSTRLWIFIGVTLLLGALKYLFAQVVPNSPTYVDTQLKRQRFIVSKVIDDKQDEDVVGKAHLKNKKKKRSSLRNSLSNLLHHRDSYFSVEAGEEYEPEPVVTHRVNFRTHTEDGATPEDGRTLEEGAQTPEGERTTRDDDTDRSLRERIRSDQTVEWELDGPNSSQRFQIKKDGVYLFDMKPF